MWIHEKDKERVSADESFHGSERFDWVEIRGESGIGKRKRKEVWIARLAALFSFKFRKETFEMALVQWAENSNTVDSLNVRNIELTENFLVIKK